MQLNQCRHRHARRAEPHPGADGRIQDPRCGHDDHPRRRLEVDNSSGFTLLAALAADAVPIQGVPAIVDFDLLPDMGRMTAASRIHELLPHRWQLGTATA
jgi:hypothetical protein